MRARAALRALPIVGIGVSVYLQVIRPWQLRCPVRQPGWGPPVDRGDLRHPQRPASIEDHGAHTIQGLWIRVPQRLLALATGIWFNWQLDALVKRSLVAYDH